MPKLSRRWLWGSLAGVLAIVGGLWWLVASRPLVDIAVVARGDAAEVVYATGVVEPEQWSKVSALQRKRIVEICSSCEGKPVRRGDVLGRLEDGAERAMLRELEARRDRIQEDARRLEGLAERNITSRVTYDEKLTQLREQDARIAAQKDRIDDLVLRAPMDGIVLRRDGSVGEMAGTGPTDVLFWVGQPKPLRVVAEVNEEDVVKVQVGHMVLLRHEGQRGAPMVAHLSEITPKGDPATKTFRVYFALPDNTPLRIGMSVEANIVVREAKDVLLVPSEALVRDGVLTVVDGRVRRVQLAVGIRGTRLVEVTNGLSLGQRIISPARPELVDGERVRVREKAAGKRP